MAWKGPALNVQTRTRVPTALSDLFFNHDVSDAVIKNKGQFEKYDHVVMLEEAKMVLDSLESLGINGLPSAGDLVEDFYGRV